jgi:hypothetical protein
VNTDLEACFHDFNRSASLELHELQPFVENHYGIDQVEMGQLYRVARRVSVDYYGSPRRVLKRWRAETEAHAVGLFMTGFFFGLHMGANEP